MHIGPVSSKRVVIAVFAALVACRSSDTPFIKPFLWVAERDGRSTVLFGTMHIGIDPLRQLPPAVWSRFEAAPAFAMETNPADLVRIDTSRHDGGTLSRDLGNTKWQILTSLIGPSAASRVDGQKPYVAAALVASAGLPKTEAMDGVFLARAQRARKRIVFLEPIENQIAALEKWLTTRELAGMLEDAPAAVARSNLLLSAYASGQESAVDHVVEVERRAALQRGRSDAEYREQMAELVQERNAAWIPVLEKFHADGGGFVAVGTLHLIGDRSVIDLLRQRGFRVERVLFPPRQ